VVERLDPGAPNKVNGARKREAAREAHEDMPAASTADGAAEAGSGSAQRRQSGRPKLVRARPDEPANDAKVVQLDKFRKR
jgi:hypothetical protein